MEYILSGYSFPFWQKQNRVILAYLTDVSNGTSALYLSIMKVLEPRELEARRTSRDKKQKSKHRKRSLLPVIGVVMAVYTVFALTIPVPALQADIATIKLTPAGAVSLPWPRYGQAALGAVGYGLLDQHGQQKPLPMASVAKVVTAVAVLKVHPIQPGTQGETITITRDDVAMYSKFVAEGQSVVRVEEGEQLTEYQALQALLLPSANNMADILVRWAFGSQENYLTFVNPFTKTLGMTDTLIADASGFSPQTVSTAVDLAKLGEIAMNQPAIAEIVAQAQADLPVAGRVYNVNRLVGHDGMVGIKTGNTDEAGGCYLFAAKRNIDAQNSVVVVGAIMGAPDLSTAIDDSVPIINEAFKNFKVLQPIATNQVVGTLSQAGGKSSPIIVHQGPQVVSWLAQTPRVEILPKAQSAQVKSGDTVGNLKLYVGNMAHDISLIAAQDIQGHSVLWRLRHAGGYL